MIRIAIVALFLCFCAPALAGEFEDGKRDYDDVSLASALTHFEQEEALRRADQSLDRDRTLAQVLVYKAATYFYLGKTPEFRSHVRASLDAFLLDDLPAANFPDELKSEFARAKQLKQNELRDLEFAKLIDTPRDISQANIERAFKINQSSLPARRAGQWLLGLSALPLGVGIGFAVSAYNAKTEFLGASLSIDSNALRENWRNQSIVADVGFALGTAMAVTGIVLWVTHHEVDL
jgi:hypothetical protein